VVQILVNAMAIDNKFHKIFAPEKVLSAFAFGGCAFLREKNNL